MKIKKGLSIVLTLTFLLTVLVPGGLVFADTSINLHADGDTAQVVLVDSEGNFVTAWAGLTGVTDGTYTLSKTGLFKLTDEGTENLPMIYMFIIDGEEYILNPLYEGEVKDPRIRIGEEGSLGSGTNNYWIGDQEYALAIEKTADKASYYKGETVNYTVTVYNIGSETVDNIFVTDTLSLDTPLVTALAENTDGLASGGTLTFNYSYTILTDYEGDTLDNTVRVTAVEEYKNEQHPGYDLEESDSVTVDVLDSPLVPSISLTKTADPDSGYDLGDEVTYTFTITNDGEVPLFGVELDDSDIDFNSVIGSLAVGETVELEASYYILEADILAGMFENTATVTGSPDVGNPVEDSASEVVYTVDANNELLLQKTSSAPGRLNLGDDSFYSFYVQNIGNVTLTNVYVVDLILGFNSGNLGSLAPGESTLVVNPLAVHEINEDDMVLGSFYNEANAYGTFQSTDDTSAYDDETIIVNPVAPTLELEKLVVTEGPYGLGDEVEYSFTVTNNGLFTVTDVQVTDNDLDGGPFVTEVLETLEPGQSVTFTATGFHTVSEADVLAGSYMNYAEAVGYFGQEELSANDSVRIMIGEPATGISITKTAEVSGAVGVGVDVYYTFEVTNTGDIDIVDVVVSDDVITVVDNYKAVLTPGETWTITGEGPYTTTENDAVTGSHSNIGSVTGETFLGTVEDSDSENITVEADPSILLDKTADVTEAAIDDTITYSFYVENTGDVTLTNVYVYDSTFDHTTSSVTLAPGEFYEWSGEVTHDVTESDAWNMNVQNFATAYGTPATGGQVSDGDDVVVEVDSPMPEITLTKTANPGYAPIGGEIVFTFTVANTGNASLYEIYVTDSQLAFTSTEDITLAPGEDYTLTETASYTLTEMDAYMGGYENTAWAYGYTVEEDEVSDDDTEFVETDAPDPSILLTKTADPATLAQIGDLITYTFEVENVGNVTLYNVYVEDLGLGFTSTEAITLLPGESLVLTETAPYTILEEDSFAGSYLNTATAYGFEYESQEPVSDSDTVEIPVARPEPGILLDKVALVDGVAQVGEVVTYEFTVTNTGTVTLYNVAVTDLGLGFTSTQLITLEPGESITLDETATYTITEEDSFAGSYTNTAEAKGWPAQSEVPVTDEDVEEVDVVDAVWSINLDKSVNDNSITLGQSVTYTITVTNTGNVTLFWGDITDSMLGVSEYFEELAPGESITITEGYTPDSGDIPSVTNTADVVAYTYREDMVSDEDSVTVTVTIPVIPPSYNPSISVTIEPDADLVEEGTDVTFTMVVTNTGNTILNNVEVTNEDLDFETVIPVLYVGGSQIFTVIKTMDEAGEFNFTVVAEGTSPQVVAVSDTDVTSVEVFIVPPEEPTPLNPATGAIPFNAFTVSGLLTLGAGIFALIKRKKEDGEEE